MPSSKEVAMLAEVCMICIALPRPSVNILKTYYYKPLQALQLLSIIQN
jgi:hypothetical protein